MKIGIIGAASVLLAARFEVSKDAIHRHRHNHLSPQVAAAIPRPPNAPPSR